MTLTNIQVISPKMSKQPRIGRVLRAFTEKLYPMEGQVGGNDPEGRPRGLFRDLEIGLLLAPPDLPLVGGGPLFLGDVLEGLDDDLLKILQPGLDGVVVALLALVVAIGAGLLVLEPLLDVLLELEERVHRFLLARGAGRADGRLRHAGVRLPEVPVDRGNRQR